MVNDVKERLIEVARRAVSATEDGRLEWTRTSEAPPEYYAHITDNTALAIRRVAGRRPGPTPSVRKLASEELVAKAVGALDDSTYSQEYLLALTTPERGEIASMTSREYSLDSDEYKTLEALFMAAQLEGDAVNERIDEALNALPQVS